MSSQAGGDFLDRLDAAITERETTARAAAVADPAPWTAQADDKGYTRQRGHEHGSGMVEAADGVSMWDCEGAEDLCMSAASSRHIALNDPASVLRRCDADRKLLARHRKTDCNGFGCDCGSCCATCRWTDADQSGDPARWGTVDQCVYPCPTLIDLAEGYGLTEGPR